MRRAELRAKLRSLLWRAWARYRPIFGGVVLRYTSLREQYVYRRAAKLYAAAFASDPGKSGRSLAAWLRRATPMEAETAAVAGSSGTASRPRGRRSRGRKPLAQRCRRRSGAGGVGWGPIVDVISTAATRACVCSLRL
mgnify:CR=1 FL=1